MKTGETQWRTETINGVSAAMEPRHEDGGNHPGLLDRLGFGTPQWSPAMKTGETWSQLCKRVL